MTNLPAALWLVSIQLFTVPAASHHGLQPVNHLQACEFERQAIVAAGEIRQHLATGEILVMDADWQKQNGPTHQLTADERGQLESLAIGFDTDAATFRIYCGA